MIRTPQDRIRWTSLSGIRSASSGQAITFGVLISRQQSTSFGSHYHPRRGSTARTFGHIRANSRTEVGDETGPRLNTLGGI